MQEAEVILCDHRPSVHADSGHLQSRPHGIAGEQLIVRRNTGKFDHAEFHYQMVDQLLGFLLGDSALVEVTLNIDVEERGYSSYAHRRAVLCFYGGKVAKIQPLHCFRRIDCRDGNIKAIDQRHFFHFVQGLDLLGQLLPLANDIVCHLAMAAVHEIFLFLPDQKVHAVERDPSVVADNSSAPDSLLQSSRDLNRDMNALNALDGNDGAFPVKRKRHDQNTA